MNIVKCCKCEHPIGYTEASEWPDIYCEICEPEEEE